MQTASCSSSCVVVQASRASCKQNTSGVTSSRAQSKASVAVPAFSGLARVSARHTVSRSAAPRSKTSFQTVCEASATPVNDNTWEDEVLKSSVPVLVDFWAPWCGPCRMIAPLIDELAGEYEGKMKAVKLNTDESPGVATEYGIRSIPTCMVFKGGEKIDTIIGAVPKSTLVSTIEKYLD
ncbi:hypothetical protein CYMTET_36092 [Cymbomonas tetramitiformis]|uniref:Thioredoxin domain-containing protein n=1 Tax=Cymbomonas tetramitiformis TaxID=36881 RepID=A0AAE0KMW4_9CHLO|nr:hypothetical protein CYMTET_36092 [Cymbomonas tetramitiformis]